LEDDFRRAEAWLSLGIDDVLEISVPWSCDPAVTWADSVLPLGNPDGDEKRPVLVREYQTPAGPLRHAVKKMPESEPGWVIQPDYVALFEDYNVPRAVKHAVTSPSDMAAVKYLYAPPSAEQSRQFSQRMAAIRQVAEAKGLFTQAWAAFGMDAAVWLTGTDRAVMMAIDEPDVFGRLLELIFEADFARVDLAAQTPGVDMVCQRGWYSSTDFWSPKLFDRLVYPYVCRLADLAHRHGKKFAYTVTTGLRHIGPRLADAGVDVLYFVDPIQDQITLEEARDLLAGRMTLVGGTNALSLASGDPERIRREVRRALEVLGPSRRFILHPVDAIFPDTPFAGLQTMIEAWQQYR
jgi:uroporphyrinogen-III decarboxylase